MERSKCMALIRHQRERALQKSRAQQWSQQHLSRLRNEIDRLFESPIPEIPTLVELFEEWAPPVEIYENKDSFVVKAELPWLKKEDIEVSLIGNSLVISGERKEESEEKGKETYRSERFFGRFQRSIALRAPVDPNKIQASYKDGVLTVTLPKSE